MEWNNLKDVFEFESIQVIEYLNGEYFKIRTGRINPNIFDGIRVDAYGEMMSLNQISSIQILDAKTCIIKPYDKEIIKEIISAISNSNLGVNPIADVEFVKINFPSITEETRIKNVKKCKEILEQAKIKLRKVREEVRDIVKKEKTLSEDNIRFFNEEIDKITKLYITKLDDIFVKKEQELMKV